MENLSEIKCKVTADRLRQFWPQWHVESWIGSGPISDVYRIRKDFSGLHTYAALKVIRLDRRGRRQV